MLFGVLLVLTWLVLLIRYPQKALPVSLVALASIGLLAAWVLWREALDEKRLARLALSARSMSVPPSATRDAAQHQLLAAQ